MRVSVCVVAMWVYSICRLPDHSAYKSKDCGFDCRFGVAVVSLSKKTLLTLLQFTQLYKWGSDLN